jgi:hypothetical protein
MELGRMKVLATFLTEWEAMEYCDQRELSHQEEAHAYRRYVEDNLERIDRGGWTPVCYHEFLSSEERETYSQDHNRNLIVQRELSGMFQVVDMDR